MALVTHVRILFMEGGLTYSGRLSMSKVTKHRKGQEDSVSLDKVIGCDVKIDQTNQIN